jgi:O-antigen/teichoic acid export membrane protein
MRARCALRHAERRVRSAYIESHPRVGGLTVYQTSSPPLSCSTTPSGAGSTTETRRHLRGSSLLLLGRFLSLGINFLVGVLTIRYLSKGDYGAFSYGLAIVTAAASLLILGMPRAVARFAPLYQERGDHRSLSGVLALSTGLVASLGALALGLALLLEEPLLAPLVDDPRALSLLLVLLALAPLQALDNLFQSMLAVFAGAGALFFRRHVLGPGLRLAAVLLVVLAGGSVHFLAWAYVGASILGLAAYGPLLHRALARSGVLAHLDFGALRLPWREVLGFGLPLLVADALITLRQPVAVVFLDRLSDTLAVADLNAFLKISGLNLVVLQSMKLLFLPIASRLLARGDRAGVDELYWKTTIWVSVATFPVFVMCIALPDTLASLVYGQPYVASSAVLAVLAVGEFANAAMGLNTYTLNVFGRVRFVLWTTALATVAGAMLAWALIPSYGAVGAAWGLTLALLAQNALHHWGLVRFTSVVLLRGRYLAVYASQALALGLLFLLDATMGPPPLTQALLVVAVTLAILRLHRRAMDVGNVFPEVRRIPVLGRFLFDG